MNFSWILTLPAVKVNTGRKMIASLPSGILVQTAASTVMIAPDYRRINTVNRTGQNMTEGCLGSEHPDALHIWRGAQIQINS